jgi:hypothetical protein
MLDSGKLAARRPGQRHHGRHKNDGLVYFGVHVSFEDAGTCEFSYYNFTWINRPFGAALPTPLYARHLRKKRRENRLHSVLPWDLIKGEKEDKEDKGDRTAPSIS